MERMDMHSRNEYLKVIKESYLILRSKRGSRPGYLLKQKIPIRLSRWNTSQVGYVKADLVVHCGSSTLGGGISIQ